jgi:hypothetical protein
MSLRPRPRARPGARPVIACVYRRSPHTFPRDPTRIARSRIGGCQTAGPGGSPDGSIVERIVRATPSDGLRSLPRKLTNLDCLTRVPRLTAECCPGRNFCEAQNRVHPKSAQGSKRDSRPRRRGSVKAKRRGASLLGKRRDSMQPACFMVSTEDHAPPRPIVPMAPAAGELLRGCTVSASKGHMHVRRSTQARPNSTYVAPHYRSAPERSGIDRLGQASLRCGLYLATELRLAGAPHSGVKRRAQSPLMTRRLMTRSSGLTPSSLMSTVQVHHRGEFAGKFSNVLPPYVDSDVGSAEVFRKDRTGNVMRARAA